MKVRDVKNQDDCLQQKHRPQCLTVRQRTDLKPKGTPRTHTQEEDVFLQMWSEPTQNVWPGHSQALCGQAELFHPVTSPNAQAFSWMRTHPRWQKNSKGIIHFNYITTKGGCKEHVKHEQVKEKWHNNRAKPTTGNQTNNERTQCA